MKRIIATILSAMVGLFGYTIVDTAIESRVSNVESEVIALRSEVSMLKGQISEYHEEIPTTAPEYTTRPATTKAPTTGMTGTVEEIAAQIYTNTTTIDFMIGDPIEIDLADPDSTNYYLGITSTNAIERAVFSEPLIGSVPYSMCLVKVKNGADIEAIKKEILEGINCRKWIMITSEKALVTNCDNIIMMVMADANTVDDVYNAFNTVANGAASKPITKTADSTTTTKPITTAPTTTKPTTTKPVTTVSTTVPTTVPTTAVYVVDSGYCGDYATWELTSDGTLTISGKGDMYDNYNGWFDYRTNIKSVSIKGEITHIGEYAFALCFDLTSINIPDTVTDIGTGAFANCSSLTSIYIPNSVTSIGNYTFYSCSNLTKIKIPDGITAINPRTFEECTSLKNIIIPDNVTYIGSTAFENCTSLTNINIPANVKSIDYAAFSGCTSLKTVTMDKAVTSIGEMAFAGCGNLTDIYYAGTEKEWNAITIEKNNALLTDANIHYNHTA